LLLWQLFLEIPHSFYDLLTKWVELQGLLVGRQGLQASQGHTAAAAAVAAVVAVVVAAAAAAAAAVAVAALAVAVRVAVPLAAAHR
jgi:hypothetical protein